MKLTPVSIHPAETIYSVIARLAAVNGSGNARALRRHLGMPFMNYDHAADAMEALSLYSGMSAKLLAGAACRPHGKKHTNIGGSIVERNGLNRSAPRYCALCVLDDLQHRSGRPATRPFERFSWTVADVEFCHVHGIRLARAKGPQSLRHEFVIAVSENMSVVEVQATRAEPVSPLPCELYFAARLDKQATPVHDLDGLPFYVASNLCARLGVLDVGGPSALSPKSGEELAAARQRGFELIGVAPGGLRQHLTELTKAYWKPRRAQGAQGLFGDLYRYLSRHLDDDHRELIDLLKEVVVDNLPLGPSDSFLGRVKARRWHSAISLARELQMSPSAVVAELVREGFIAPQQGFEQNSFSQIIVDAERAAPLFPRQVFFDRSVLIRRMKLDRFRNTCIFAKEGDLALPRYADEAGVMRLYSIEDAEDLLRRLTADVGGDPASEFCRLPEAAARSLCSINEVLTLLESGKLEAVRYQPEDLFEGILVSPYEVRTKTKEPYPGWVFPYEIAHRLGVSQDDAFYLLRHKILPGERVTYRYSSALITSSEVIAEFERRYVSLASLAKVEGKRPSDIARRFAGKGIDPAIFGRTGRPLLYHRQDVEI